MLGRGAAPHPDSLAYLRPYISSADLSLANLESPFAPILPPPDSTYNLCALSVNANLLPKWGIALVSLANNHNLDCGKSGPSATNSALEAAGIAGIGPTMEPVYREVNGLHLAFLAFDDISSTISENAAEQAIRSARLTGALVIVSVHWGAEYQSGASDRQKYLAKEFADSGAALIWGHHPHVLQPAAWIETLHGKTLVLYSLGNALFDQGGLEDTRRSALVLTTLNKDGVSNIRVVPFVIDVVKSRVGPLDDKTAGQIRERLHIP